MSDEQDTKESGQDEDSSLKEPSKLDFNNITDERLQEIVQNIRIDAPDGKMSLNAIMVDLAVGHNELEQYKHGALSLYKAVDERLQEEERRNPNSAEIDVLSEVKDAAFGLYLRIQRGDEELHGNRDGKYSGYFDSGGGAKINRKSSWFSKKKHSVSSNGVPMKNRTGSSSKCWHKEVTPLAF